MKFFSLNNKISKADKIQLIISYFLQFTLILALTFAIYRKSWLNIFAIVGILLLTFLPALLRRSHKVHLPIELDFAVILFVYAALFLGEMQSYYLKYWWWDILLHTSSGILLGFIGFFLVYILNKEEKVHVNLKPGFISLFSFTFAVGMGIVSLD